MADLIPPGTPMPQKKPVTAADVGEVARKAAALTKKQYADQKSQLTGEKKKPKHIPAGNAKRWHERIDRSAKLRKDFEEDRARFLRYYQGDYSGSDNTKGGNKKKRAAPGMNVNIIYSHVEIITPAVYSGFPFIKCKPRPKSGEAPQNAEQRAYHMQLVVNYWMKELAVDLELHDAFFDNFFSLCVVELGWETVVEDMGASIEHADDVTAETDPGEDGGEPMMPAPELRARRDGPFCIRRDPDDFFIDPDARRRREARWVAIRDVMLYNDFLDDPVFNDMAKKKLKPTTHPDYAREETGRREEGDRSSKEWVEIFYVWDKDTRKKYAIAKGHDFFLEGDPQDGLDWPYEMEYKGDGFPFCVKDAKRDAGSPYSWSEFKAYESQILELNRIRNAMQIHASRSLPRYMHVAALGSRDTVNKLMKSRSDESTQVDSLDAIKALEPAQMPQDMLRHAEMAKDDLLNISGLFEFQSQSIADTATEASLIEGRSQVRKSMRSKEWEQYVVEIAAKIAQLCQQNMDQPLAVEIAGQQGVEWLDVTKDQIQGEFHFEIEPGIMEYKNEALRKQQLLKFMELTANDINVNRRQVILSVAKEMELPAESFIIPEDKLPPPPPEKPNVQFKDIDPSTITDPRLMNSIIIAALKQNGVPVPPEMEAAALGHPPPPPPGAPGPGGPGGPMPPMDAGMMPGAEVASGKDISGMGANPNGNPALPPVQGNLMEGGAGGVV